MTQIIKIYFLSVFLLLGGYLGICASFDSSHSVATILEVHQSKGTGHGLYQQHAVVGSAQPGENKVQHKVYAEKNEEGDDDFSFVKKITESRQYLGAITSRTTHLFSIEKRLFFRDHYPYFSTSLYIIFRTIRI